MAFDGDADRVILSDENGLVFDGDRVLCLLGTFLHEQGQLANDVVVGTIMSNMGLGVALQKRGVRFVAAPVGDRYVAEAMEREGAILGGEKSGHFLLPRLSPTGDGMLAAIQVLAAALQSGRKLSEMGHGYDRVSAKISQCSCAYQRGVVGYSCHSDSYR